MKCTLLILLLALSVSCGSTRNSVTPKLRVNITAGPSLEASLSFEQLSLKRPESEVIVGKWASQKKHGTARQFGQIAGPRAASMAIINITQTTFQVTYADALPLGAAQYAANTVRVSDGQPGNVNAGPSSPRTVSGLTANTSYRVYGFYANGAVAASDWIYIGTITTLP